MLEYPLHWKLCAGALVGDKHQFSQLASVQVAEDADSRGCKYEMVVGYHSLYLTWKTWDWRGGNGMTLLVLKMVGSSQDPCRCRPSELLGKTRSSPSREFSRKQQQQTYLDPTSLLTTHPYDIRPLHSLMLRTSIRSVRGLSNRPVAAAHGRQWQAAAAVARPAGLAARVSWKVPTSNELGTRNKTNNGASPLQRYFADEKTQVPKPPTTDTNTASSTEPPPPRSESNVVDKTIPAENVPLTPPAPEELAPLTNKQKATVNPPPPAGKGFFQRLRNYILTLAILGAVAFGGGVYYSRINDDFHDFFTEYVPYGEQAVLYLEEMEFRKRFPNISNRGTQRSRDTGEAVRIPAQHGMSWRVADSGEPAGRHSNASEKAATVVKKVTEEKTPEPKAEAPKPVEPKTVAAAPAAASTEFKTPEVNEPSRLPPPGPLQPVYFPDVDNPVVQDLAHMVNDLIAVINADGAQTKYGGAIEKAKNELNKVRGELDQIKADVEADAAKRVKARMEEFDKAANDLVTRVESAMASQEASWQKEFDQEMRKVKETFDERIKLMTEREKQLSQDKLNNKLLEQAVELKKAFAKDIKKHVEEERDSRLGKLQELSKSVSDLEKLAASWNEVIDMNLRTQQLHVAVDAVRASLEDAAHPRPFIKELVALKEIAADDAVVNAAIASINPTAYQRGVSNSAELIDRFRRVATEVRKASLLPEDAGVASHASSYVLSKVMFKKQGLAEGDDVESILTRTQTFLEEGDLDAAAREMNGLTGWAKTLSRDWLGEVRKVLEVRQALEVRDHHVVLRT